MACLDLLKIQECISRTPSLAIRVSFNPHKANTKNKKIQSSASDEQDNLMNEQMFFRRVLLIMVQFDNIYLISL